MKLPRELAGLGPLAGATVTRLVRDLPERRVFQIQLCGQRAFLKQFRGDNAVALAQGACRRLTEAAAALGGGLNRVATPLIALPEHAVLVTAAAAGQPLARSLEQADPQERARLIARAGAWLAALAGSAPQTGSFGPRFWLRNLQARAETAQGSWIDRDLVRAHLARMQADAQGLRQAPVIRARLHGDLTPDNLFHDPATDRLTAIDLQDWGMIALVRDMARLLVWLESRSTTFLPRHDGIASADHQALTRVPGLMPADQRPLLRFMIAEIMLAYYLDSARQPQRRAALAEAMRDWAVDGQDISASAVS